MAAPARAAAVATRSAGGRLFAVTVAASLAAAAMAVFFVTSAAPVGGAKARAATTLRVADMLAAPGGVVTLPDGRQLRARTVEVGGCAVAATEATVKRWSIVQQGMVRRTEARKASSTTTEAEPATQEESKTTEAAPATKEEAKTTEAAPATKEETTTAEAAPATKEEAQPTATKAPPAPTAAERACMASTPDALVYKGFEGVVVEANGFRFSAGVTISDVDAEAGGGGWAETMSSVGRAGNEMVVPSLGAPRGSAVGVKSATLPSAAAAELGWKAPDTRMLAAVSSASVGNCVDGDGSVKCTTEGSYATPVDTVLIMRAFTSVGTKSPPGDAWSATITVPSGCECTSRTLKEVPAVFPLPNEPGTTCTVRQVSRPTAYCDFMGSQWCETAASTRWTMIDAAATRGDCVSTATLVDRPVGAYAPALEWKKEEKATPAPTPTPTPSPTMAPAATAQPSKEGSTATKDEPKATKEGTTATKEEPTATKEGATTTKEEPTATKEGSTATTEESTATKEGTTATKEGSTATKERSTATTEESKATKEGTTATKEGSTATKEESTATKEGTTATRA